MHGGCYNRFEFPLNNLSNLLTRCCLCTHAREDTSLAPRGRGRDDSRSLSLLSRYLFSDSVSRASRPTRFYKFIA